MGTEAEAGPEPELELEPEPEPEPEPEVLHQEVKACEHELQGAASLPYVGFPVGITDTPERGYCVVARRPLSIGEVAWQCRPWAAVSSDACLSDTCAFCFRTAAARGGGAKPTYTARCERCMIYHYCSEECKAAAQPLHALECRPAREVVRMTGNSRRDSTATRLLVRMLAQRRLEMQQKGQEFAAGEKVQVGGLKGAPQHNGKRGEVLSFDRGKGRYLVRLDSKATQAPTPKPLGIKPSNLLRVAELCEPRDTGPLWSGATFSDVQKLRAHLEDLPPERVASLRTVAQGIARVPGLRDDALGEGDIMQLLGVVQWCVPKAP